MADGDATPAIVVHRVYEDRTGTRNEYRVLVDRLWPRGVSKSSVRLNDWAKDLAPSTELRRWYGHDPARFQEFSRRYGAELRREPALDAANRTLEAAAQSRTLVLVTATRDVEHSGAVVLARHLESLRMKHPHSSPGTRESSGPRAAD